MRSGVILISLALVVVANGRIWFSGASNKKIKFESCGGKAPNDFRLNGCVAPPCKLSAGQNHTLEATFRASRYTASLNFEVITLDMPRFKNEKISAKYDNFCNYLVGKKRCPIQRGTKYQVKYGFHVPIYLPDMQLKSSIVVKSDNGEVMWCVRMPIHIVGAKSPIT